MDSARIKLVISLVALLPFLVACPKHNNQLAPIADTDVQSSAEVMYATFLISDIEMIASYLGESNFNPEFYIPQPNEPTNGFNAFQNTVENYRVASFNNVKCLDGHKRNGSVYLRYGNTNPNALYYQNYQFHGLINIVDYRVDGWLIQTINAQPCHIYNKLSSATFDPSQTNLTWTIEGSFEMIHPSDPSKNMTWSGKLTKTLVNTSDPQTYNSSRLYSIDWTKAMVEYRGNATGITGAETPYFLQINDYKALTRDFNCYPNEMGGIMTVEPLKTWKKESHPFNSGVVNFNPKNKYPRIIYCGNEGIEGSTIQCDNAGIVVIKGNSYPVNFY